MEKCDVCNGTGVDIGTRIEPDCCMCPNDNGSCCGNPQPREVPEPIQCEKCKATGFINP